MKKLKYCVYALISERDRKFYIGYTTDLGKRLTEHMRGRVQATAHRRPLDLVFCEYYLNSGDAKRREKYLKTAPGKRGLKLMLKNTLCEVKS